MERIDLLTESNREEPLVDILNSLKLFYFTFTENTKINFSIFSKSMDILDGFKKYLLEGGEFDEFNDLCQFFLSKTMKKIYYLSYIISCIKKYTLFDIKVDRKKYYRDNLNFESLAFVVQESKLAFCVFIHDVTKKSYGIKKIIPECNPSIIAACENLVKGQQEIKIDEETKRYMFLTGEDFDIFERIFVYYTDDYTNYVYKNICDTTYKRQKNVVTVKNKCYKCTNTVNIKLQYLIDWKLYLQKGEILKYERIRHRFNRYRFFYMTKNIKTAIDRILHNLQMLGYNESSCEIKGDRIIIKTSFSDDGQVFEKSIFDNRYCIFSLLPSV